MSAPEPDDGLSEPLFPTFRRLTRVGAVVLVAAIVAFVAVRGVRAVIHHYQATPGVVPGYLEEGVGMPLHRRGTVALPSGDLVISSTSPVRTVPADDFHGPGRDGSAEEDTSAGRNRIVGVAWSLDLGALSASAQQFHVALIADGHRYPLPPSDSDFDPDASWWVVIAGRGESLRAEVEYDGQVQTLDLHSGRVDAGRAAPFYDKSKFDLGEPKARSLPCQMLPPAVLRRFRDSTRCDLEVSTSPYIAQLGWAKPGRTWAVVAYSFRAYDLLNTREGVDVRTVPGRLSLRIDGAAPATILDAYRMHVELSGTAVFDVPTDRPAPQLAVRMPWVAKSFGHGKVLIRFGVDRTYSLR